MSRMTKALIGFGVLFYFILFNPAYAQWEYGGIYIVGDDWFTRQQEICLASDYGVLATWEDERHYQNPDLYAQKIDSAGYQLWEQNGVLICNSEAGQYGPHIASDGNGGAFIAWSDLGRYHPYEYDVYAQHISANGALLWPDSGLTMWAAPGHQIADKIISDGLGGALIMMGSPAVVQRVDSDGNLLFGPDGLRLTRTLYSQVGKWLIKTTDSNFVAVWQDSRQGFYAQKFTVDGMILWEPDGMPVTVEPSRPENSKFGICSSAGGGVFSFWSDYYNHDGYISMQWNDGYGQARWGPTGMVFDRGIYNGGPHIESSWDGRAIIAWLHWDSGYSIIANIVDTSGVKVWEPYLFLRGNVSSFYGITSSISNEFEIAFSSQNEKILKYSLDDGFVWGDTGILISCPQCPTVELSMITDGVGGSYFAWKRADVNSVLLNRVYRDGWVPTSILENNQILPQALSTINSYPNPFNSKSLLDIKLINDEPISIDLYDILGRKVKEIYSGNPNDLQFKIPLDLSSNEYSSGIYFVELCQRERRTITKITLLK